MDAARLIDALARGSAALKDASAVILFGSHATGRARADSDIDVGVLLADSACSDRLAVLRGIVEDLATNVAADRLHVTILNDAAPVLAYEVLRDGVVVGCADPVALHRFRMRTYRVHADYEHVERLFRARTASRAANG